MGTSSSTPAKQAAHYKSPLYKMRMLYDYTAEQNTDELTLHAGDILAVLHEDPSGWFQGRFNGVEGKFPSNYAEKFNEVYSEAWVPLSKSGSLSTASRSLSSSGRTSSGILKPPPIPAPPALAFNSLKPSTPRLSGDNGTPYSPRTSSSPELSHSPLAVPSVSPEPCLPMAQEQNFVQTQADTTKEISFSPRNKVEIFNLNPDTLAEKITLDLKKYGTVSRVERIKPSDRAIITFVSPYATDLALHDPSPVIDSRMVLIKSVLQSPAWLEQQKNTLFIRNLPNGINTPEVRGYCKQFGDVMQVNMLTKTDAEVIFVDAHCVDKALKFKTPIIQDHQISFTAGYRKRRRLFVVLPFILIFIALCLLVVYTFNPSFFQWVAGGTLTFVFLIFVEFGRGVARNTATAVHKWTSGLLSE